MHNAFWNIKRLEVFRNISESKSSLLSEMNLNFRAKQGSGSTRLYAA